VSDRRNDTDKRFVTDRRKIFYKAHAPESRSGYDRRSESGRRSVIEQRKYKRFLPKDPTFVTLWIEHEKNFSEKDGQLLDISRGGIALRCIAKPEESNDYSLLEIFLSDDYSIEDMPFKIVSGIEMTGDSASSELTLRRYGIQFDKLTSEQTVKLDYFLANHTLG
jgi:c-di-GMP-binding flagellar brake protein YcgR